MRRVRLLELANIIRSKNSGPYELTLDVFFKSEDIYRKAKARHLIDRALIGKLYRVPDDRILDVVYFDPARAVKVTIARSQPSGSVNDTDVYGAQQHMPLADAMLPWEEEAGNG